MSFWRMRSVKAKKEHLCEWCGEKINKNEVYVRHVGVWNDEFQCYATHSECWNQLNYSVGNLESWESDELMVHEIKEKFDELFIESYNAYNENEVEK